MDATALLAHILSQTRQNVDFLVAQKQISQDAANEILAKLPKPGGSPVDALTEKAQNVKISSPALAVAAPAYGQGSYPIPPSATAPSPAPSSAAPTLPPGVIFRAKAQWDYNQRGENAADLSFRGGDIIDVIAETNADWWTGRHNGRQGLFPANHVERLASSHGPGAHPPAAAPVPTTAQAAYAPPSASAPPYAAGPGYSSYTPPAAPGSYAPPNVYTPPSGYAPPGGGYAPPTGYAGPPPPGQSYSPYASQPGYAPGSLENNESQDSEKKKHKMGGLGQTFATAAVGGVGFGAGSAIGSGIIDSIF